MKIRNRNRKLDNVSRFKVIFFRLCDIVTGQMSSFETGCESHSVWTNSTISHNNTIWTIVLLVLVVTNSTYMDALTDILG